VAVICPALCLSPRHPVAPRRYRQHRRTAVQRQASSRLPSPQGSRQLIDTVLAGRMHLPFQETQFAEQQRMIR
jgi:hypothetical protein